MTCLKNIKLWLPNCFMRLLYFGMWCHIDLFLQLENISRKLLRNVSNYIPVHTASQHGRLEFLSASLISYFHFTAVLCPSVISAALDLAVTILSYCFPSSVPCYLSSVKSHTRWSTLSSSSACDHQNTDAQLQGLLHPHLSAYLTQNRAKVVS